MISKGKESKDIKPQIKMNINQKIAAIMVAILFDNNRFLVFIN